MMDSAFEASTRRTDPAYRDAMDASLFPIPSGLFHAQPSRARPGSLRCGNKTSSGGRLTFRGGS
jgi:hypothetical protein